MYICIYLHVILYISIRITIIKIFVVSHSCFDCIAICWTSFHVAAGHLYVSFGIMFIQVFCPFFFWLGCFYCCCYWEVGVLSGWRELKSKQGLNDHEFGFLLSAVRSHWASWAEMRHNLISFILYPKREFIGLRSLRSPVAYWRFKICPLKDLRSPAEKWFFFFF